MVDSVAALVPKAELEGEMGDHHMALQARLMSQALRKLNASLMQSPGVPFTQPHTYTHPPTHGACGTLWSAYHSPPLLPLSRLHHYLHQPNPVQSRRVVWEPGRDQRRQRPEVLRVRAAGHPSHWANQRRGRRGGEPDPGASHSSACANGGFRAHASWVCFR